MEECFTSIKSKGQDDLVKKIEAGLGYKITWDAKFFW